MNTMSYWVPVKGAVGLIYCVTIVIKCGWCMCAPQVSWQTNVRIEVLKAVLGVDHGWRHIQIVIQVLLITRPRVNQNTSWHCSHASHQRAIQLQQNTQLLHDAWIIWGQKMSSEGRTFNTIMLRQTIAWGSRSDDAMHKLKQTACTNLLGLGW